MNKRILISHIDADGLGSIILCKYFNIQFTDMIILNYDEFQQDIVDYIYTYDDIWFTDLSPSEEMYKELIDAGKTVHIYDHHESSLWLVGKPNVFHDLERCGTKIFYEEYVKTLFPRVKPIVRQLVELIDTYDRWQKDSPLWEDAKNLAHRLLYQLVDWNEPGLGKFTPFVEKQIRKLENLNEWRFLDSEMEKINKAIVREEEAYQKACKMMRYRIDTKGRKFVLFMASAKISITASRFLEASENADIDYCIIINTYGGINGHLSCRSRLGVFDCTSLYHFNGHKEAAGADAESHVAVNLWEETIWCMPYVDEIENDKVIFQKDAIEP